MINKKNSTDLFFFLITVAYSVFAIFLHQEVSMIVVGKRPALTGSFKANNHSVEGGIIFLSLILIYLIYRYRKGVNRLYTILYIYFCTLFIYIYFELYSLHPVEVIHIIHYSVLTLLLGCTFDRERRNFFFTEFVFIGFFIGFVDELLQYLVLIPAQKFLDFNDIYVNMLGAIAGILLFYSFVPLPLKTIKGLGFLSRKINLVISIFVLFTITLILSGNIRFSSDHFIEPGATEIIRGETVLYLERYPGILGSYLKHFIEGYFYNLNLFEWLVLSLITLFIVLSYDPRNFKWFLPLKIIRRAISEKSDTN